MQSACKENTVFPQTMTRKHGLSIVNSHSENAKKTLLLNLFVTWTICVHKVASSHRDRIVLRLLNVTEMGSKLAFGSLCDLMGKPIWGPHSEIERKTRLFLFFAYSTGHNKLYDMSSEAVSSLLALQISVCFKVI